MIRAKLLLVGSLVLILLGPVPAWSGWQEDWNQALAKARSEGSVVLGTTQSSPAFREKISKVLMDRFGIRVEVRSGRPSDLAAIATRECASGQPSMDVILSGMSEVLSLYPKGCLAPVKQTLLLPEVTDTKNWKDGQLKWNDPDRQYFFQTTEYVEGWTTINSQRVNPKDLDTARELLSERFKGKIASFDPRRGGPGQATATFLFVAFGDEFVRALYSGQKVAYTTNYRQLADWIARGTYLIGLGQVTTPIEPLRKEGLPIGVVAHRDFPGFLSGGGGVLKLVKQAPHPNAAVVLINWLASQDGQEFFSQTSLWASRRIDVTTKGLPGYSLPKAGVKYLDNYDYDFYAKKRAQVGKKLKNLLGQ